MIIGVGVNKSDKLLTNEDIDYIIKKDSKNITPCVGNKPIPKNVFKPMKMSNETSADDKFIMGMRNIIQQSNNKEIHNITIKNYIINTCTSECEKKEECKCKRKSEKKKYYYLK